MIAGRSADVAEQLLAAVLWAKREAAHVVVALTPHRRGSTTDAALARRVATREHEEVLDVDRMVRHSCVGTAVTAEVVVARHPSGRFASTRRRRSTAAVQRLARRRGGGVLNNHGQRELAQVLAGELVPGPGAYVAVALPDSAEAGHVAQAAAELAQASGQPLDHFALTARTLPALYCNAGTPMERQQSMAESWIKHAETSAPRT